MLSATHHTPVTGLVQSLVRRRVHSRVLQKPPSIHVIAKRKDEAHRRVDIIPNAVCLVARPAAHRKVRVVLRSANGRRDEITPTLAHSTALAPAQAARVGGAAGQTGRETVGELVDNDTGFEIAVPVRLGGVPDVHAATAVLTIRGLIIQCQT